MSFVKQIESSQPGTNVSKGSSRLGCAGGAAIGVGLLLENTMSRRSRRWSSKAQTLRVNWSAW